MARLPFGGQRLGIGGNAASRTGSHAPSPAGRGRVGSPSLRQRRRLVHGEHPVRRHPRPGHHGYVLLPAGGVQQASAQHHERPADHRVHAVGAMGGAERHDQRGLRAPPARGAMAARPHLRRGLPELVARRRGQPPPVQQLDRRRGLGRLRSERRQARTPVAPRCAQGGPGGLEPAVRQGQGAVLDRPGQRRDGVLHQRPGRRGRLGRAGLPPHGQQLPVRPDAGDQPGRRACR